MTKRLEMILRLALPYTPRPDERPFLERLELHQEAGMKSMSWCSVAANPISSFAVNERFERSHLESFL